MDRRDMIRKTFFGLLLTQFLCLAYGDSPVRTADPSEFPFQVSVRDMRRNDFLCSGVLITNKTVLVPASCVSPDALLKISAGSIYWRKQNRTSNCETKIVHPKYKGNETGNDIALIRVTDPFKVDDQVAPAAIPSGNVQLAKGTSLSGWNVLDPDDYLKVYENYTLWRDCKKRYNLGKDLGKDEFCGDYTVGSGHGSLLSKDGVVYGLITNSSTLKKVHVFVEISHHADWIRENLGAEVDAVKWHRVERNEAGSPSNCLAAMLLFAVFLCQ